MKKCEVCGFLVEHDGDMCPRCGRGAASGDVARDKRSHGSKAPHSPHRIIRYLKEMRFYLAHRLRRESQEDYYARWVDDRARIDPCRAVGSTNRSSWMAWGQYQFDYLRQHGLQPHHHFLDIGCGNLRGGRHVIAFLNPGNYTGVDISKEVILAAQKTVCEFKLQQRRPYLFLIRDMDLGFLPIRSFDVVHAHSVFTHCGMKTMASCFQAVSRLLKPGGFFDFTFFPGAQRSRHVRHAYYFHVASEIEQSLKDHGLKGEIMSDWKHRQKKIRARLTSKPEAPLPNQGTSRECSFRQGESLAEPHKRGRKVEEGT